MEEQEAPEQEIVQESEQTEEKPDGSRPVDVNNSTPEQIQRRIDHLYGQSRDAMKENRALKQEMKMLKETLNKIESRSEVQAVDTEINHLIQQRKEAREAGDYDKADELSDKIGELKAEKRQAAKTPQRYQEEPEAPDNADDMMVAAAWGNEIGDDGRYLRPWAQPNHRRYNEAVDTLRDIYYDPANARKTIDEKLAILERKMTPTNSGQNVLGRSAPRTSGDKGPQVTEDQRKWALRTYNDPKYAKLTEEQKIKKWVDAQKRSA